MRCPVPSNPLLLLSLFLNPCSSQEPWTQALSPAATVWLWLPCERGSGLNAGGDAVRIASGRPRSGARCRCPAAQLRAAGIVAKGTECVSCCALCRDDFVLRKDVEVRRFRWTVTDTAISRDSGFLLYCSISPQAHLVRIGSGGANDVVHSVSNITEVHEEIDFLVRPLHPPPSPPPFLSHSTSTPSDPSVPHARFHDSGAPEDAEPVVHSTHRLLTWCPHHAAQRSTRGCLCVCPWGSDALARRNCINKRHATSCYTVLHGIGVEGAHACCAARVQAGAEVRMSIGVWSLAWSPSDSIVAAGTSQPGIILYDLAAERRLTAAACHHDDVNAVAFADEGGNLLVSGSDDSRLFLLDRCAPNAAASAASTLLSGGWGGSCCTLFVPGSHSQAGGLSRRGGAAVFGTRRPPPAPALHLPCACPGARRNTHTGARTLCTESERWPQRVLCRYRNSSSTTTPTTAHARTHARTP